MDEKCCAKFNPKPWDNKKVVWKNKVFLKDHVASFFHVPLNFGAVATRMMKKIFDAKAMPKDVIMFTDENSLFGADVFVNVTKPVPNSKMEIITGKFLSKVFEGPFKNMGQWIREMKDFVASKGQVSDKFYYYYTTCPKCAKLYGKNYVVILAKIS